MGFNGRITYHLDKLYHCDLTGIMVSKVHHPQMALIQVSELIQFTQISSLNDEINVQDFCNHQGMSLLEASRNEDVTLENEADNTRICFMFI
jgi:hypothetical protein